MTFFKKLTTEFRHQFGRVFIRSLVLAMLLVVAGGMLDFLINLARTHGSDIPDRFPEILLIFRAVAILTWFEMSILWIRLSTSPQVDTQEVAQRAADQPMSAAVLYVAKTVQWIVRLAVLMQLCDFLK